MTSTTEGCDGGCGRKVGCDCEHCQRCHLPPSTPIGLHHFAGGSKMIKATPPVAETPAPWEEGQKRGKDYMDGFDDGQMSGIEMGKKLLHSELERVLVEVQKLADQAEGGGNGRRLLTHAVDIINNKLKGR